MGDNRLSQEKLLKALTGIGLKRAEAKVYFYLAKRGPKKASEIVNGLNMKKQQLYPLIRSLQNKGIVNSSLDRPAVFSAIPFDKVLDFFAKTKLEEVKIIQTNKGNLLSDWESITLPIDEDGSSKFTVIKGRRYVYSKIQQMFQETKQQLLAILSVPNLMRADHFGLFDKPFSGQSKANFRFITELNNQQNFDLIKSFFNQIKKTTFDIKGRNPELGMQLFPRMVIRDNQEIIFFTTPTEDQSVTKSDNVCLWTNSKALIESFQCVFEELWATSTDIEMNINELKTGKSVTKNLIITDEKIAKNKYNKALHSVQKEILIVTSSMGLLSFYENKRLLRKWIHSKISVKILAPITNYNLTAAKYLLKFFDVRHAPQGYLGTTIIDGQQLFQFKYPPQDQRNSEALPYFTNTYYSYEPEYIIKTKSLFNNIWRKAQSPELSTLNIIKNPLKFPIESARNVIRHDVYKKVVGHIEDPKVGILTEKDVINRIINGQKYPAENWQKSKIRYYGSMAQAIIRPPKVFNLPDLLLLIFHNNKQSSFEAEDIINFFSWIETPKGNAFVPVAVIQDNPKSVDFRKAVYANTPAAQNIQVVGKNEIQVRVQGNTLFAGWTVPIELLPEKYTLPPSAILFEGYGDLKTEVITTKLPSGRKQIQERNFFEAFVTFFHPSSKYAGPGTDGLFCREAVFTSLPLKDD